MTEATLQQHEVDAADAPRQPRVPLESVQLTTQIGALTLSREFEEIVKTLGEIQASINQSGIAADKQNEVLLNPYSSLPAILKDLSPVLKEHGVTMLQPFEVSESTVSVTTVIVKGKQFVSMTASMTAEGSHPYAIGSAVTYCCRYSIRALLSLAVDGPGELSDDDGVKASGVTSQKADKPGASHVPATVDKKPADKPGEGDSTGYSDKLRSYLKRVESSDHAGLTSAKSQVPAFKLGEKEEKVLLNAIEERIQLFNKEDPK